MPKETTSQKSTNTSPFADWSEVSKRVKKNRRQLFLLSCLCIAFFIFLWPKSKLRTKQVFDSIKAENATQEDYQTSLNENLVYLQSKAGVEKTALPVTFSQASESKLDKNYLARQNAPTGMYLASFQKNTLFSPEKILESTPIQASSVAAKKLTHPDFTLAAGEFLQAVLETAVDSDFPGSVRAILSQPVYAYTGTQVLIPAGSRLQGHYESAVLHGQNRVMISWDRVLLPNGLLVNLESPGTDSLGRVGQGADHLSTHFVSRFGQASLLSLLGAGASQTGPYSSMQVNNAADQYRTAVAQSFQQSAQQSLQETNAIQSTLHVYQGTALQVFVMKDINFFSALDDQSTDNFS